MQSKVALTVLCAVSAALAYALSNVLQQREAEQIPDEHALHVGLLTKLARRPWWVVGTGADVAGYVFEALALGAGTLVLVEPILATALVFSLLFGTIINRRAVSASGWLAATVLAMSVALFLYQVSPQGGGSVAPVRSWLVACPPIGAFMLLCVHSAAGMSGPRRAALLAAAAGVAFGVSAVLTKAFVHYLGDGPFAWIPHWEPYGLAISSIGGLVLAQSAFQTGALAAAVGAEQVMQPLTGVALGVGLLDERIATREPLSRVVASIALLAMVAAVIALARIEHPGVARPVLEGED